MTSELINQHLEVDIFSFRCIPLSLQREGGPLYYIYLLKKMQALCAVMRKLLHAIHAMFKTQKAFEGTKFYAGTIQASA